MGAEEVLSSCDPGPEPLCFLPVGGGKGGGAGGAEGERVVHKPGLVVQGTSSYYDHHQDNSTSDWSPRQAPGTEVLDVRSPAREPSCPMQMTSCPHQTPCR